MTDDNEQLPSESSSIDYLLVADYAEVINGKAYIIGGGWDRYAPSQYPASMRIGIAIGVRVPYLESNTRHQVTVVLSDGDGKELFKLDGDLETGRPPGSRGESSLVPLAVNGQAQIEKPQLLELMAKVNNGPAKRVSIRAAERS